MFINKKILLATALITAAGFATTAAATIAAGTNTFTVSLQVTKTCSVTAGSSSNITLNSVVAGATTSSGTSSFKVNCSKGTPFYIGLAPSNANTAGAGSLKGTGSNTDTIAYQLYAGTSSSGAVWGNTATSTSAGSNGVSGSGTGMGTAVTENVAANATGTTDVTPDTYSDTVTINVNF